MSFDLDYSVQPVAKPVNPDIQQPDLIDASQPVNETLSSSDQASLEYSDWPAWVVKLRWLIGEDVIANDEPDPEPTRVMTWYVDHEAGEWCTQPRIVHLGQDPSFWNEEIQFPWLPQIPYRERVFIDVVSPDDHKYPFETHVADVILTTRPVMFSVLVSTQIQHQAIGEDDEPFEQLLRAAGMLAHSISVDELVNTVPGFDVLVQRGFHFQLESLPENVRIAVLSSPVSKRKQIHDGNHPNQGSPQPTRPVIEVPCPAPWNWIHSPRDGRVDANHADTDENDHSIAMQVTSFKHSPHTDAQDIMLQAFHEGHAQPHEDQPNDDSASNRQDSQGYSPSIGSQDPQGGHPEDDPDMQDVFLFRLNDQPIRVLLPWNDYNVMMRHIAWHYSQERGGVVDAYELAITLPDLPDGIAAAIVHFLNDVPVGQMTRHVLVDIELHGHKIEPHFQSGPLVRRSVYVVPARISRRGLLANLNVDQYCRMEGGRCLVFHNLVRWPDWDESMRDLHNGDCFKVSIPPSEAYECSTDQLLGFVQRGYSHDEILEQISVYGVHEGYSPSLLGSDEVRALRTENIEDVDDVFMALQSSVIAHNQQSHAPVSKTLQSCTPQDSLTDEILRFARTASNLPEDAPEFPNEQLDISSQSAFVQDLWEGWTDNAVLGPGGVEPLAKVQTWFTNHASFHRCMMPRTVVLSQEYSQWERQILSVWPDIANMWVHTEFHLVYPKPEDAEESVFAQVVLVQRPEDASRSLVISVYDSSRAIKEPFSFCQVLPDRVGIEEVLETSGLTETCSERNPQNECSLWFGSTPIRPNQKVHVRSGYAFRLSVRRGIFIEFSQLTRLSDEQLRAQLISATHTAVYRRPDWPAFSSDVYGEPDHSFRTQSPTQIDNVSEEVPASPDQIHDSLPPRIALLRIIFDEQSRVDDPWEGPFIEVLVWYLNGQTAETCRKPRVVRLDSLQFSWRSSLIFACLDDVQRAQPIDIHLVRPSPPRAEGHTHAAHVIVTQQIPSDLRAVVISTNMMSPGVVNKQFAFAVPRRMSATDVRSAISFGFALTSPSSVYRAGTRFSETSLLDIEDGDGIVIEDAHDSSAGSSSHPAVAGTAAHSSSASGTDAAHHAQSDTLKGFHGNRVLWVNRVL
eukprot:s1526_g4.t1